MKGTWWKEAVVYQVYPRSFMDSNGDGIGDLKGITQKLDYLQELGIDVIWICPMYKSPNDDNGYDISDYQDIMDEFGSMEDFDELLNEVHKRDMKLILDLVINHTSDEHAWFIESRSSKNNPKRDWYIWRDGKNGKEPNNWESIFGGPAWKYDEKTDQYFMHIFSTKQPDLNWENPEVREALYSTVNWWLDKGIDGFRVDAISHIKKRKGFPDMPNPEGKEVVPCFENMMNVEGIDKFLTEFKNKTLAKYDIMTVGEANGVSLKDADKWVGEENGYFNMIFQFEHLGLWNKGTDGGLNIHALKETLTKWQNGLEGRGWNALFLENHDQPRSVSTWGNENFWKESATSLAAMYFLMKGTPYIYQGQEIGMTNVQFPSIDDYNDVGMINFYNIETKKGRDPQEILEIIWKNGRDNSRTPMQWDASKNGGFSKSDSTWFGVNPNYETINVKSQLEDPSSIYHFYKSLIELRKRFKTLVYGKYDLQDKDHEQVYAYTRTLGDEVFLVLANLTSEQALIEMPSTLIGKKYELKLGNYESKEEWSNHLKPYEARIYRFY
ncbi:glycoside hydrolase family 13 protein [Heyndrickxia sp. NPDC080065]|uniref:glycoside hydrolase family 13 protein n=1 Tax=Heyndrickxia sp. NPDC080065 TaxID=3390568 RepID=UPI003D06A004